MWQQLFGKRQQEEREDGKNSSEHYHDNVEVELYFWGDLSSLRRSAAYQRTKLSPRGPQKVPRCRFLSIDTVVVVHTTAKKHNEVARNRLKASPSDN